MPSLLARLIYKVLWVLLYRERSKTSDQYIAQVIDVYESQNQPETIPAYITQDKTITTSEYSFESERTGQTWQTFTLVPKKQVKKQVCVYFHGGAWVMAVRCLEKWVIRVSSQLTSIGSRRMEDRAKNPGVGLCRPIPGMDSRTAKLRHRIRSDLCRIHHSCGA